MPKALTTPSFVSSEWLSAANLVSAARLLLTPFIVQAILQSRHRLALALLLAAGISDALDGALARRFGSITRAGAYLDPIADKLLLSAVYIALWLTGITPRWVVAVIFARDLLILACAAVALRFTSLRNFPPSVWGKVSTFCQIVYALVFLVHNAVPELLPERVFLEPLHWLVAAITIFSGAHYAMLFFSRLSKSPAR
ncbi:MAG: CDP-alcohol phosphatidyltransferase family protein [Bryobacteraceae bacterium]